MLSSISVSKRRILQYVRSQVRRWCEDNNAPIIPVIYGETTDQDNGAEFTWYRMTPGIILRDDLSKTFFRMGTIERAGWLIELIAHELIHYRDYLSMLAKGEIPTRTKFDERRTKLEGLGVAVRTIEQATGKDINPTIMRARRNVIVDTQPKTLRELVKFLASGVKPLPLTPRKQLRDEWAKDHDTHCLTREEWQKLAKRGIFC